MEPGFVKTRGGLPAPPLTPPGPAGWAEGRSGMEEGGMGRVAEVLSDEKESENVRPSKAFFYIGTSKWPNRLSEPLKVF